MKKKLTSILITNYNKEKFLKKSLRSVCGQNFKNYEIILFDDCSSDDSINIIKKFKKIRLIKNPNRVKKSAPLNQINGILQAFKKSKGDIICLMDSDDFFIKNKIAIINKEFKKNKDINCIFNFPKSNKNQFNFKMKKKTSIWPTIFPTSCISFRRNFFKKFIKNLEKTNYPNLEIDARLTIFSNFFNNEYNLLNKQLTHYAYDENGITANKKKFSWLWWIRRDEAYKYLRFIMKKKQIIFKDSLDYYITLSISYIFKICK
tara:strand:- start:83 stop:865 length:783 start_codon:yes stop_codon:yes gene_type:complete